MSELDPNEATTSTDLDPTTAVPVPTAPLIPTLGPGRRCRRTDQPGSAAVRAGRRLGPGRAGHQLGHAGSRPSLALGGRARDRRPGPRGVRGHRGVHHQQRRHGDGPRLRPGRYAGLRRAPPRPAGRPARRPPASSSRSSRGSRTRPRSRASSTKPSTRWSRASRRTTRRTPPTSSRGSTASWRVSAGPLPPAASMQNRSLSSVSMFRGLVLMSVKDPALAQAWIDGQIAKTGVSHVERALRRHHPDRLRGAGQPHAWPSPSSTTRSPSPATWSRSRPRSTPRAAATSPTNPVRRPP